MEPIDFKVLAAPFDPADLDWRVGQKSKDGRKATVLAYVTSRAVQARLDAVVGPDRWRDSYVPLHEGGKVVGFLATLEIQVAPGEWVGKSDASDTSDIEAIKGGVSGALKRVAVKWGIGRYLYDLDTRYLPIHEGYGADGDIYCPLGEGGKGSPGHVKRPVLPLWALPARMHAQRRAATTGPIPALPPPVEPEADVVKPEPAKAAEPAKSTEPEKTPDERRINEMRDRIARLEEELGVEATRNVRRDRKMRVPPETEAELTAYGKALRAALDAGGNRSTGDKAA